MVKGGLGFHKGLGLVIVWHLGGIWGSGLFVFLSRLGWERGCSYKGLSPDYFLSLFPILNSALGSLG